MQGKFKRRTVDRPQPEIADHMMFGVEVRMTKTVTMVKESAGHYKNLSVTWNTRGREVLPREIG